MANSTPDFSSFSLPVTHAEQKAYLDEDKSLLATVVVGIILAILLVPSLAGAFSGEQANIIAAGVWLGIVLIGAWIVRRISYKNAATGLRARRFAGGNGFTFQKMRPADTTNPGTIFQRGTYNDGDTLVVSGVFGGRAFEYGTHSYTVGSGRDRTQYHVAFVRVNLSRKLPHVLIDGRKNVLNLGQGVAGSEHLSLEGDFDKYFTVYCPAGYETDVLYFLTPELMQLMIDHDQAFDMEVIDDKLYFYRSGSMKYDETEQRQIFQMLQLTGGEFAENTRLYKNDQAMMTPVRVHKQLFTPSRAVALLIVLAYGILMGTALAHGLKK